MKHSRIIKDALWNIISSGLPADDDIDIIRKIVLSNLIIILGGIFLGFLSIIAYIQGDLVLSSVDSSLIVILIGLIYYLRKKKNPAMIGLAGAIITGIFYLFLILHGGIEQTAYLWALTYPIIVLFLLGKHLGTLFSITFLVLTCFAFFLGAKFDFLQSYSISVIIRLIAVLTTIYLIALVTEVVREKVQKRLERSTDDLIKANQKLVMEIEARKRIEKALRANEGFLDDIIESIQDGICVLDLDLTIRHTNSVMKTWFRDSLPLTGKKCHLCFRNQPHPCDPCPTIRCLKSGKAEKEIVKGLAGSPVEWLEVFSFPIKDKETGEITGAVEFVRDITKSMKLEGQLARAQKMEAVGTLAGGVAHDLNNILSGIVSYPELLLMDLPYESPMRAPIETMHQSGKKAAAIVQDLLTLARRGVPNKEVVNLKDTISAFFQSLEFASIKDNHPQVTYEVDLQEDLLNTIGSPIHLSKTIMNLVSNGSESIKDSGTVKVTARNHIIEKPIYGYEKIPEGNYIILSVMDSGAGIPPNDIHKIFEPFYTKKNMGRSGTGLGMAVVWGTVKDINGFIDIQSCVGSGTRFDIYLPATSRAKAMADKVLPIDQYRGHEKVLVIDDVKEQREIASAMLKKIGYSVEAVSSGEEAIQFLTNHQIDMIILDMVMSPGMDGFETYKEILKLHPNQKAIIASGYSETEQVRNTQKLGAGKYIKKPYTIEDLGLTIRTELDNCSSF